ncbi:hypothetical protein [Petroclostridium xylanilyticum]|jgi:uncharacterized protein YycO|uniref:hypothetical protein n=1 Tax=Petroclostridium xylanilyticum TaxID=1792311 RepID=UPI000B97F0EC|nr:hypothetical protein [Petroclostridium xylanilyticum]
MKVFIKKIIPLIIVGVLCVSNFSVFAAKDKEQSKASNKTKTRKQIKYDKDGYRIGFPKLDKKEYPEPDRTDKALEEFTNWYLEESANNAESSQNDSGTVTTLDLSPNPPTGTNTMTFSVDDHGSIFLVHDGYCAYGAYRHAGLFNGDRFVNLNSACIATATPEEGTTYQTPNKFRSYDECVALYVKNVTSSQIDSVVSWADTKVEADIPYKIKNTYPNDYSTMYCSKMPYGAYREKANKNIGNNVITWLPYVVLPLDLYLDNDTVVYKEAL